MTITTPLQERFVISGLGLAMMKLRTKFEIYMFTNYEDTNSDKKYRDGMRVMGH